MNTLFLTLGLVSSLSFGLVARADDSAKLPKDVTALIGRMEACEHWAGEQGGDDEPGRRKEIEAAFKKNRCDKLGADTQKLKKKYQSDATVIAALDAAVAENPDQ